MRPPGSLDPRLASLDRLSRVPLQEQLYERFRRAIAEGRLTAGKRVPSTRALANELGVARGTVDAAYARLAGEGYLVTSGPAGTIVSPTLRPGTRPPSRARPGSHVPAPQPAAAPLPFQMGLPALDMFPRTLWARLAARAAKRQSAAGLAYPDPAGLPGLREAIAAYLAVSRGVLCEARHVVITGGYQAAISVLARVLLRPGDKVWFEEPGYFLGRQALEAASARLVAVPVDDDGMRVDRAVAQAGNARLAVVTPAHQSPLGVALSLPRRQALLAWAEACRAWILEDDYDSEFHYVGRKLPALKSLDAPERVIYAGSFSKTLFPGLRLGYLVAPPPLVGGIVKALRIMRGGEASLGQAVAAEFMAEGHFARHLKRMRGLYAERRAALAEALLESFGTEIELPPRAGGMHLLARFPRGGDDTAMVRRALAHHLAPTSLSSHYIGRACEQGLLLSFTNIPQAEAFRHAEALRRAIG
jgi:GntR family transcriptional regulator/MocR family aminotransferase